MTGIDLKFPRLFRAAAAALFSVLILLSTSDARGWSEFGMETEPEAPATGEIREPFFAFLVHMVDRDSIGTWDGHELAAFAADLGRASRFPLDEVVSISRVRDDPDRADRYTGAVVHARWRIEMATDQDNPMPYSILGYHPGSLRVARVLELAELEPRDVDLKYSYDGEPDHVIFRQVRVFPLESGYVVLDADGLLDAVLGSALDDAWTLGFVLGLEGDRLVGLGVSIGKKDRSIFGEFDFVEDKVMANGRPPAAALSRSSRVWLTPDSPNLPPIWYGETGD